MKRIFKIRIAAPSALMALMLLFSGLNHHGEAGRVAGENRAEADMVIFDMSHREIFSPVDDGPLHYSSFFRGLAKFGVGAGINTSPVTRGTLESAKVYVIAGPTKAFGRDEIGAIKGFVRDGGNLLVLLHISSPVARLTEVFEIVVSNFVISDRENTIEGRSQDFLSTRFSAHPVTSGLKGVAFFGTWGFCPWTAQRGSPSARRGHGRT